MLFEIRRVEIVGLGQQLLLLNEVAIIELILIPGIPRLLNESEAVVIPSALYAPIPTR